MLSGIPSTERDCFLEAETGSFPGAPPGAAVPWGRQRGVSVSQCRDSHQVTPDGGASLGAGEKGRTDLILGWPAEGQPKPTTHSDWLYSESSAGFPTREVM